MIQLISAVDSTDFATASDLLTETAKALIAKGQPLWTDEQVSIKGVQNAYALDELFFLQSEQTTVGVVFLQTSDSLFWPELPTTDRSLFIHKLAIHPTFRGKQLGPKALDAIKAVAINQGHHYLRLDCHGGREPLRNFYEGYGFQFVDRKELGSFDVARYALSLRNQKQLGR